LLDRAEDTLRRAAVGRMGVPARACAADAAGTITVFGFPVPADDAGRAALAAILDAGLAKRRAVLCVPAPEGRMVVGSQDGAAAPCGRSPSGGRASPWSQWASPSSASSRRATDASPHRSALRSLGAAVTKTLRTRVTRRAGSVGAHSRPVATCAPADARPMRRAAGRTRRS
jgi:hypothetical protein